jgi:molybdopterin molybdotransferase
MDHITHTVAAYRSEVLALARPLPVEDVPLVDAVGRVAATTLRALQPVPLFDNSAMDGYAVRSTDLAGSDPSRPVRLVLVDRAPAGHGHPRPIGPGEAVRIMTGAPIPEGADLVVPVELSTPGAFTDLATVELWLPAKSNIRAAGEDVAAGDVLVEAGTELGARLLALLAATGHSTVAVHRRPRVAVLSSGDELSDTSAASAGTIPDSNAVYLAAAVRAVGGVVTGMHRVADRPGALEAVLDAASRDADLIVSTGGLGAGSHDFVGRTAAGSPDGLLARVGMRPGRPQACGTWNGVPWIALPGTPTAAFVSFEAFVRPVLGRLGGLPTAGLDGTLAETVSVGWEGTAGTVRFVPLAVTQRTGGVRVEPMGHPGRSAHALSAMYSAPLIGVIAAEVGDVVPGQLLTVIEPA